MTMKLTPEGTELRLTRPDWDQNRICDSVLLTRKGDFFKVELRRKGVAIALFDEPVALADGDSLVIHTI